MTGTAELVRKARQVEREYCRTHPVYFVENYCHIEDKDSAEQLRPFTLWPMQKQALGDIVANRLSAILKARQLGMSWLVISVGCHELLFSPGSLVIALSRTEDEAKELVRRLEVQLANMPDLLGEDIAYEVTALQVEVRFSDGRKSVFKAFPSSSNAGRSYTANLLILDEWAFQQWARKIWKAVYPTINRPTGGRVIGLSTIERGTLFEEIFTTDNGFKKIFLPWFADPRRTLAWYEQTKADLGDDIMQEYPATVEEALTIPGGAFFPEVKPATHVVPMPSAKERAGWRKYICIDYGLDMLSVHQVEVDGAKRAVVTKEFDAPDMRIEEACEAIHRLVGKDRIELYLAPNDLWSREQVEGRDRADWFREFGIPLTRTSRDRTDGAAAMKEWLKVPVSAVDGSMGRPRLVIAEDMAPNLLSCLMRIQKHERKPGQYAEQPHHLTHDPDSLRAFCIWWARPAAAMVGGLPKLPADVLEDYRNAGPEGQRILREQWGMADV